MDSQIMSGYIGNAINKVIADVIRNTIKNPKETAFFMGFGAHLKKNELNQKKYSRMGYSVPSFLIAQTDIEDTTESLSAAKWSEIFAEAVNIGISFIVLSGKDPLLCREVIKNAALTKNAIFPIFTSGELINKEYAAVFDKYRNLVPFISADGRNRAALFLKMENILFGCTINVKAENILEVTSEKFISELYSNGCRIVFFTEDKPFQNTLTDKERALLEARQQNLKSKFENVLFFSFPADEALAGGCLAAGKGFIYINSRGDVQPCPYSPYSDTNINNSSLLEAISSPLFKKIQKLRFKSDGCPLIEHEEKIKNLIK